MHALVTGGTGFIGSHVVEELLKQGHSVRVLSRTARQPQFFSGKEVETREGDLKDFESVQRAMDGIRVVYHVGEIKNRNVRDAEQNVVFMEKMTGFLKAKQDVRIVFISSITVSGIPAKVPAGEDATPEIEFNDHYTAYKRKSEGLIIDALAPRQWTIIRPGPVYGPRSKYMGKLLRVLRTVAPVGIPFVGDGNAIVPLIEVKDLARATCAAGTEVSAAGQVFNITDGLSHTWRDFLEMIMDSLGRRLILLPVPPIMVKLAAFPVDLFSGIFNAELDPVSYVNFFTRDIHFDNTKAKKLLRWEPSLDTAHLIKSMVQYYEKKLS